ncbi:MAG TPA: hypothetical protein VJB94_01265 [Candidatus Nanoarchaeia archaeon]|nr:hypothetical protein [Candidatus Nanoarchaeia archaeon]
MKKITEEKSFPEDLEGRLSSVLNSINTELKSVTLLHLDDKPAGASEIKSRIRNTVGEGYLPEIRVFRGYGSTLYDIALVAKETITKDDGELVSVGYSLTDSGKKYGLPIAAFTLRYAANNDISMFSILGVTQSRGKTRATYNRIRILEELSAHEKLREIDLISALELDHSAIMRSMDALAKIHFVEYNTIGAVSKGKFVYRWIKDKEPHEIHKIKGRLLFAEQVARALANFEKWADCNALAHKLRYKHAGNISCVLSRFVEQGLAEKTPEWKAGETLSNIKILDKGKRFLDEWVHPIKEALEEETALIDSENITDIKSRFSAKGIELYRTVSPGINSRSADDRIDDIINYLAKYPNSTSKEIKEAIGLTITSTEAYLKRMKNRLCQEKKETEVRYSLNH